MPDDDMKAMVEKLQAQVAAQEAQRERDIEVIKAAAAGPPTLRQRRAESRAKLRGYHDDVRAGKRQRVRTSARGEAVEEKKEGEGDAE